jgi:glutamate-ammonia-ligase adenylyltransferase
MTTAAWQKAIQACADPQRAREVLEKLQATDAARALDAADDSQSRILAALFSGSQAMSDLLVAKPQWLESTLLSSEGLAFPRRKQGQYREVCSWLKPALEAGDYARAYERLRQFKQREMLRIAARDLARLSNATEITQEITNVADVCLEAVFQICWRQLTTRFGVPYHRDADGAWQKTGFTVIGLGKLGGQDLNYSSDIDVIFVYDEEGTVFKTPPVPSNNGESGMSSHQFFTRLAEAFIAEIARMTPDGFLFRIDLRLRPEGQSGPLARSLASYENYYAQWGQTWERMMLIKARGVAGDGALAAEFIEMIQPFRYPRSLGERILGEIAVTKQRIENEVVKSGEIDRNVKLGRGGIREIEFVTQTLQILNAGRIPFLQESRTLPALKKLVDYRLLSETEAASLTSAWSFLRDVEHRLQMEANLQTHTIPLEKEARQRLAALMGFPKLVDFERALKEHTTAVRKVYDKWMHHTVPENPTATLPDFEEGREAWTRLLEERSFREPQNAAKVLQSLVHGPGYVHVSSRTIELARDLLPRFLKLCPVKGQPIPKTPGQAQPRLLSDPDRVLARLDSFVAAYGARSTLFETWAANPSLFDLLLLLFDRSEFLAEIAIHVPDLVDDLMLSGRLRRSKTAAEILKDLRYGYEDADQRLWIRRYHQAEFMRIGLREILGLADYEQNLLELTALAEACLQYALEVVMRERRLKKPPLAIIGLGKLGGAELTYGSDLDLLFVADSKVKNIAAFQALGARVMELLSSQTELGVAFKTDARLRPNGEKGLLVTTLAACEDYYRNRAMLWEIQTLTRSRPVAGDPAVGAQFQKLASTLTNFSAKEGRPAAFVYDWKRQIAKMRQRIEKERVPAGRQNLAFKTGAGGLMDAEFIAQTLCLEHGWQEPNTLKALEKARDTQAIPREQSVELIENYRHLLRIECVLRRWSYEGESELPVDPAPQYRVAIRCGFSSAQALLDAMAGCRKAIRRVYDAFFALDRPL